MRDFHKKSTDLRRQHNTDLIRRMRGGDPLNAFDSKASWYPPRPLIEKDKDEMARLYKGDQPSLNAEAPSPRQSAHRNVVQLKTANPRGGDEPMGEAS